MRARATIALSALLVALGVVLIAETVIVRGTIGYLLGALFVLAGVFRARLTVLGRWR